MKSRSLFILFALLACLVVSSPALALPIFDLPLDPIVIPGPILTLDPCFNSTVTLTMGTLTGVGSVSGTGYYTTTYKYELSLSGTPVAHVLSDYRRVVFGSDSQVTMNDTIIIYGEGVDITIFGRSVNEDTGGIYGAHGVIMGAVTFNGQNMPTLKGTYRITDQGGTERLCIFLE